MVFHAAECAYCIPLAFASAAFPALQLRALMASWTPKSLWSRASFRTEPGIKCVRWSAKKVIMNDNGIIGQRESFSPIASDLFNKSRAKPTKTERKLAAGLALLLLQRSSYEEPNRELQRYQGASLPLQDTNNSHWNQWHLFMSCGNKMEPPIYFSQWYCCSEIREGEECACV